MLQYYDVVKKELILPYTYNKQLIDIPYDTMNIIFYNDCFSPSHFNQEIKENVLPNSLTHLTFGYHFNQEIKENILPNSLTHLIFGYDFNQEIKENVLPNSLTHLTFGYHFNQEIKENVLPNSLIHLNFGRCFSHNINNNAFPTSLKEIGFFSDSVLKDILPNTIEKIFLSFPLYLRDFMPCSDAAYYISNNKITNLPTSVKEIITMSIKNKIHLIKKIPYDCVVIHNYIITN
jgi:hypothetical protein